MKNLRAIRRVLYITMGLNLVAMAAKLIVGYWTGALSLVAGGFDSLFDSAGNVIGLVGIYLAARPADPEHPYGHRKFETMAAISISLLLFLTTWELLQSAWGQLRDLESIDPTINAWSFVAMAVSLVVQLGTAAYEMRAGRRFKSDVLIADARHTRADLYVSLSVIAGLIAIRLGYPVVDPLLAIGIAVVIFKIGIDIIRESSQVLLDGAIIPVSEIERIVLGVRDVRACHDVRSRGHEDAVYVDLHIKVAPEMSTMQSHAIAHDVQYRLRSEMPAIQDVVVHVEPENEDPAASGAAETALGLPALRALAAELDLSIHDIVARWVEGALHVEAHVTLDGGLSLGEAHERVSQLERESQARIEHLAEIVTHIEPSGGENERPLPGLSRDAIYQAVQASLDSLSGCGIYHELRVYPEGENWAVSLHCLLDPDTSLRQAHATSSEIENQLYNRVPRLSQVTVHMEPMSVPADPASGQARSIMGVANEGLMNRANALEGMTVVDLTQAMAGPFCAMTLGDLGADVIKVERPGVGDQSRTWGPPFEGGESSYFMCVNRNKRSVTLNLKTEGGRAAMRGLLQTADVFITNLPRDDQRVSNGVDWETLHALNPRLIYCLISGYGSTGPDANRPGYDLIAQGLSGLMSITGEPGSPPMRFPLPIADIVTGLYSTIAIEAALLAREQTGRGQFLDLSLQSSQVTWLTNVSGAYFGTGKLPAKVGNAHPNIAPYGVFEARDDYLIVAAGTQKLWGALCEALSASPEDAAALRDDPRFADNRDRVENRPALTAELNEILGQHDREHWLALLDRSGIPCAPILNVAEALSHPQLAHRGSIVEQEHLAAGTIHSVGNPILFSETPVSYRRPPPRLGEHTDEVLGGLGYTENEIDALRREGAI